MPAKSLQSCLTLYDSLDCSPPGSSVHGILQARILEWVAMPSSRGSSFLTRRPSWLLGVEEGLGSRPSLREGWLKEEQVSAGGAEFTVGDAEFRCTGGVGGRQAIQEADRRSCQPAARGGLADASGVIILGTVVEEDTWEHVPRPEHKAES